MPHMHYGNTALLGASQVASGANPLLGSLLGVGATAGPSVSQSLGGGLLDQLAQADRRLAQPVQQLNSLAEQARLQAQVQRDETKSTPQVPDETSDLFQQQLQFIQDPDRSTEEIQQAVAALRQRNMLTPRLEQAFQERLGDIPAPEQVAETSETRQPRRSPDSESRQKALVNFLERPDTTMEDVQGVQKLLQREQLSSPQLTNAVSRALQRLNTQAIRGGR